MTPVTRMTVTLDDQAVEILALLEKATGASKSELIRRGLVNHWFAMEKVIAHMLNGDELARARQLFRELKNGR